MKPRLNSSSIGLISKGLSIIVVTLTVFNQFLPKDHLIFIQQVALQPHQVITQQSESSDLSLDERRELVEIVTGLT